MNEETKGVSAGNRRVSMQLTIQEEPGNSEGYYHQPLREEAKIDHQPWPQTKKQHGPRRSRRQSVLAEELAALGMNSNTEKDSSGEPKKANKHWTMLARELKQIRLKHEAEEREAQCEEPPSDNASTSGEGSLQESSESKEEPSNKDSLNGDRGESSESRRGSRGVSSGGGGELSSQASQKLAKSNKLEDQINLQHLVELMRIFHEADENGSDGLDIDEFRAAFGQILGKGKNDQQMAIMFMKIDTNCDGTVDWDEFCTYMLLEYQEKEVMAGEKLPPFPYPLRILNSPTHEMVSKITFLPSLHRHAHTNGSGSPPSGQSSSVSGEGGGHVTGGGGVEGRYVSVCRDGTLCFWKSNLTLQRAIMVNCDKPKLTWVTDLVVLPNVNKMILSFTDNMLALYDLATANCDRLVQIVGLPHCVLHMDYWFDPNRFNHAVLVMGDAGGGVTIMEFTNATSCLFVSTTTHHESHRLTFAELVHNKQEGLKVTCMPKVHNDWVCKVKFCPSMSYVMSSSNDCNCSLYMSDLHGRKEGSILRVRKGVTSFDYCKEWNIIGTGGLDRILRYWNPYVTGKPIAVLKGHSSAIMHVAINSAQGHVLGFSKDLELRVWSIQHQLCVQSCHRCQPLQPHPPTGFFLHPRTGIVLVGTNQIAALESSLDDEQLSGVGRGEVVSHEKQLCAALYNENFNQVVSGCHGSVVSVWDVDTGEKTIQFSHCHGSMEITAMAFDTTGRRLITGGRDGSIKIWNFNNGACLSVLESRYSAEVTCICFMKQRIIVGGWCRRLAVYGDMRDPDDVIPKYWGVGAHNDDILCMAYQEPNTLASASYDGDIVVWNLDVERPTCRLNANNEDHCRGVTGRGRGNTVGSKVNIEGGSKDKKKEGRVKDEHAIEKIAFLKSRDQDLNSATLIACGTGGWVQLWNHNGGGLIGEFNIWDNTRHTIDEEDRALECITALRVDSKEDVMVTGNSLGYIQMWNISNYCMNVPDDLRPVRTPPDYSCVWRGHLSSIVSIDLSENKGLLITASTDCSVRMWTMQGRYIGTFGEKLPWHLMYPIRPVNLPRKTPPGINRAVSYKTLQTISGPCTSKWKLARNLFRLLRQSKRRQEAMNLFGIGANGGEGGASSHGNGVVGSNANILGKCYERKTRFRDPIIATPLKQVDGRLVGIYSTLPCADVKELEECRLPSSVTRNRGNSVNIPLRSDNSKGTAESYPHTLTGHTSHTSPKHPHTEQTLLQTQVNRKVTIF